MKAISLWQPWATLIATGHKTIETRSWATQYRGPLLIHAAKRPMDDLGARLLAHFGLHSDVPYGAVLCETILEGCYPTDGGGNLYDPSKQRGDCIIVSDKDRLCGNFALHRFGWLLRWQSRFDPIPFRGRQQLFEVPDEILHGVRA